MDLFEPLPPLSAARTLLWSGGAAIAWSSVLGFMMLVPMQPWARRAMPPTESPRLKVSFKQVGAAHLDWIVLGLMLGLAAGFVVAFDLAPPALAVGALAAGAWLNPLPYVFRAFGVNAFVLGGPWYQVLAALLGLTSSLGILFGWGTLLALSLSGTHAG